MDPVSRGELRLPEVLRGYAWEPAKVAGLADLAASRFCKKLIDILQRVDEQLDLDPRSDHSLQVNNKELSDVERNAAAGLTADIDLT